MAHFHLTIRELEDGRVDEYDGVFAMRLNTDGGCTRFEEWYYSPTIG